MEGVAVGIQMDGIDVDDRPDLVAQKRQVEFEPGAEQDPVEVCGRSVGERRRLAVDRLQPWPHRDSALRHQRQVLLGQGDAGRKQRRVGCGRTVLLGTATGLDHDLLQLPVDLGGRKNLVRQRSVPREDPTVRGNTRGEFRQDVALTPLGDHDGRAVLSEFRGDLEGADGTTRDQHALLQVWLWVPVIERRHRSGRPVEAFESENPWCAGCLKPATGDHNSFERLCCAGMVDQPAIVATAETVDSGAEPDA